MNIESIRDLALSLPLVSEDVKWDNDLCFLIAEKMFCVVSLEPPLRISLKVRDEEFDNLIQTEGIIPAPYMARHHWVSINDTSVFNKKKWQEYIVQSYNLVKSKLPKKKLLELELHEKNIKNEASKNRSKN